MYSRSLLNIGELFPDLWSSIVNGFHFFFDCFGDLFTNDGPLSFIPFFLFISACFGALTCVLGLIGSGITAVRSSKGGK